MKQLENAEEKERVALELKELVERINKIIKSAPDFLIIRFEQLPGTWRCKCNPLNMSVSEEISYP